MERLPDQELIQALLGYIRRAEELMGTTFESVEQDIYDDELPALIRRYFGAKEANIFRQMLRPPVRIYTVSRATEQIDRADCLENVWKRLMVLNAGIERGEHVPPSSDPAPANRETTSPPAVFISHSGENEAFYRLTRFLNELGVQPIIAEWLPFGGRSVPDQVSEAIESCAAAIVFATRADQVGDRSQPGRGALIETGILRQRFGERVIYLVEEGAEFGPMAENFARESFTQDNLERVFHRLVVELKAYGLV